jgi:hypothetical protein
MADTPTAEQTAAAPAATAPSSPAPAAVAAPTAPVKPTVSPAAAAQTPASFKVSLEHFATQLSARDKRVALIHGWVHTEKVAKRFKARYQAFEKQPV